MILARRSCKSNQNSCEEDVFGIARKLIGLAYGIARFHFSKWKGDIFDVLLWPVAIKVYLYFEMICVKISI